jgi:hypothetical protein
VALPYLGSAYPPFGGFFYPPIKIGGIEIGRIISAK